MTISEFCIFHQSLGRRPIGHTYCTSIPSLPLPVLRKRRLPLLGCCHHFVIRESKLLRSSFSYGEALSCQHFIVAAVNCSVFPVGRKCSDWNSLSPSVKVQLAISALDQSFLRSTIQSALNGLLIISPVICLQVSCSEVDGFVCGNTAAVVE